jgi:voltage-gated potassium channel
LRKWQARDVAPARADAPHYWRVGARVLGFGVKGEVAMGHTRRLLSEVARIALSLAFVFLVGVATAGIGSPLFFAILLSAGLAIVVIPALFPASRLFSIAFANLIAVYATIFTLFADQIFARVNVFALSIGFCLPVLFFVGGCWLRQSEVRAVVAHPALRSEQRLFAALVWLVPIAFVGAAVFLLSRVAGTIADTDLVLIGTMTVIGLIVLAVSRDVAIFLVDAGLLFEEFFSRIARLVIPAFAFLTFYSLIVILFASAYRILSHYTGEQHFYVGNAPRALSFSESIYFSIVSITTVGYGDIVPQSSIARLLASIEVVCGFMLLLFGVSELLEYMREHRRQREEDAAAKTLAALRRKPGRRTQA